MNSRQSTGRKYKRTFRAAFRSLLYVSITLPWLSCLVIAQVPEVSAPSDNSRLQPGGSSTSVSGIVVNALTDEPLSKAVVRLSEIVRHHDAYEVETDNGGHFSFSNLTPSQYTLSGQRRGYLQMRLGSKHNFQDGTVLTLSAGAALEVTFKLAPQSIISGRVVDEDGEALDNTQIVLFRRTYVKGIAKLAGVAGTVTNDMGEFRLAGLGSGAYYIQATYVPHPLGLGPVQPRGDASSWGYYPLYYPGVADISAAEPIHLGPGQTVANLSLTLRRTRLYSIRGAVRAASPETLVEEAMLTYVRTEPGTMNTGGFSIHKVSIRSDNGSFVIPNLAPGSYELTVLSGRRVTGRITATVVDRDVTGIVAQASDPIVVRGQVVVEGQTASSTKNVQVVLTPMEANSMAGASAKLHVDGTFLLDGLSREKFHISVVNLPDGAFVKSITSESHELTNGMLDLTETDRATLRIVLKSACASMSGTVTDFGDAVVGLSVVLAPENLSNANPDLFQAAAPDQNGRFTFSCVTPGKYLLYALEDPEPGANLNPDFLKTYQDSALPLTVSEGDHQEVKIQAAQASPNGG